MSIGYEDFLNHLSTKFIARRSDIIVSSTLSITLTPQQDDSVAPAHFAKVESQEIEDYVMLRQEYRASQVESNRLPKPAGERNGGSIESSVASRQNEEDDSNYSEFDDNSVEERYDLKVGNLTYQLPRTLLSEPLEKKLINRLTQK